LEELEIFGVSEFEGERWGDSDGEVCGLCVVVKEAISWNPGLGVARTGVNEDCEEEVSDTVGRADAEVVSDLRMALGVVKAELDIEAATNEGERLALKLVQGVLVKNQVAVGE